MDDLLQKDVNATNEVNLSSFTEDLKLKKHKVIIRSDIYEGGEVGWKRRRTIFYLICI